MSTLGNRQQDALIAERIMGWQVRWTPRTHNRRPLGWSEAWVKDPNSVGGWFKCPSFTWCDADIAERKAMEDGWKIATTFANGEFCVEYDHHDRDEWGRSTHYNRDQASMDALCEMYGVEVMESTPR